MKMSDQEQKLLYNEFSNHASFCRHSLMVETEGKAVVPMVLSPGQTLLREAIQRQRDRNRPVRIIYLKSRRIQATTGTAAEFFHETAFRAGVHTAVMAHSEDSTNEIFKIYRRFHTQYKIFAGKIILPKSKLLTTEINYEYGGDPESSYIHVKTAGSTNFGRGSRLTNVHFSEFPYYENPKAILASVMSAVPKLPDTCAVIEGTAKTIGDLFHQMWQQSMDPAIETEWVGIFMGWWQHPSNRMPLSVSLERFANSLTKDEREIQGKYNLDMQQLAWRRWTILNDCQGDMAQFKREHPATPEESFTANSRNRFSVPHIQRMPIIRECMVGEVSMEDIGGERKAVFLPGEHGAVKIYRMPERGRVYACGADPSGGIDVMEGVGQPDPDFACAHFFDRDSREQCAVLRARLMPGEFGRYVFRMLKFYNDAQVAVEKNGVGIGTLEALLNEGYPAALIYHRPVAPDKDPAQRSDRIGWDTGEVSRQQLLSALDEAIRHSSIFVHDPVTQQELLTFIINSRGKAIGQSGCHDDTVLALALTVIVMAYMPRPVPLPGSAAAARPQIQKYGSGQDPQRESRGSIVRVR